MSALPQAFGVLASQPSQQLLASVWQRNLPVVRARLALLSDVASLADADVLTPIARQEAADVAHKLAGSLGMFGYLSGTEIARELELLLEAEGPVSIPTVRELAARLVLSVPV